MNNKKFIQIVFKIPGAHVRHEHQQKFPRGRGVPVKIKKFLVRVSVWVMYAPVTPINFFLFESDSQNDVAGIKIE